MIMKKNKSFWLLVPAVLLITAAAALFFYYRPEFAGSRAAGPDFYRLDPERMTGTDTHALDLKAGDTLEVRFETEKGALRMEISAPDGTALYSGRGREPSGFTLSIPEGGVYTVSVKARGAAGAIHIQVKETTL